MTDISSIRASADQYSLTFYTGELPTDDAVIAAGHEPNGYFWVGVARFLDADLIERLEVDSEAGMFAVYGTIDDLTRLQGVLEPILADPQLIADLIVRARETGFDFDD